MSTLRNKELVRRFYEEVFNAGEIQRVEEFVAPNYVEVYRGHRHELGIEGARQHAAGVRRTYPDLHLTIEQQIAEGEWVVTRLTMCGTHLGAWQGIQPTGRWVEVAAVNIDKVVDGKIVEHGGAADLLGPFLEIGAVRISQPGER